MKTFWALIVVSVVVVNIAAQEKEGPAESKIVAPIAEEARSAALEKRVKQLEAEIEKLNSALRSQLEASVKQLEFDKNLLSKLDKSKNQEPSSGRLSDEDRLR